MGKKTGVEPYFLILPVPAVHSSSTMNILGINAYHGNASAAILCDGKLIAAAEEERFNRVKYAAGFPVAAIRYCLQAAGNSFLDLVHVAVPCHSYPRHWTKPFFVPRNTF